MSQWVECSLTIKGGKYMKVRTIGGNAKLFIVDLQDEEKVLICSNGVKMAFQFFHDKERYFLKVEEGSLKLESAGNASNLSKSHWFTRDNPKGGEHYRLTVSDASVDTKTLYLCIRGSTLGLGHSPTEAFQMTHEKKKASITN